MDTISEALKELKEFKSAFDKAWEKKFGPDDTIVMTPDAFFKELEEMKNFNESK